MNLIKKLFLFSKKQQKGMALIMVLSTIVFIILIVQETVFDTQIEYRSAIDELNSLKAYYAAKSGMEVNILRVKTYIKINETYGAQIKPFQSAVDLIWKFPFQWPPPIPGKASSQTQEDLVEIKDTSFMQAQFITSIEPENSRIDINDLASPIPSLRKWTFEVLYNFLYQLRLEDQKLAEEMSTADIMELLTNIIDYVDPDSQQKNSTISESGRNINRSFTSLEELHEVEGMSDNLYTALEPFITIYGEKGLNINTAPVKLLQALHIEFPIELAQEIALLRSDPVNPLIFTEDSFREFLNERGFPKLATYLLPPKESGTFHTLNDASNTHRLQTYLYFDTPRNFKMQSIGTFSKNQKTLTATYFDTPYYLKRTKALMEKEKKLKRKQITDSPSQIEVNTRQPPEKPTDTPSSSLPKYIPTIIYWKESF